MMLSRWLSRWLFTYLIVVMALTLLQRKLMYHPTRATFLDVAQYERLMDLYPDAENVTATCDDGVTIRGWHLCVDARRPRNRRPLIIYFHGNAGDRSTRGAWYELFREAEWDVLAYDYHGYGDSDGKISEAAIQADCRAIWQVAVEELGYSSDRIVVMGTSLGGAAAIYTASRQCHEGPPPAGLITVATFSSMVEAASFHYPWVPVRLVLADRFPSIDRMVRVSCPILMLHGDADRVVPQSLGADLFAAAPDHSASGIPKRWVNLRGFGHNRLPVEAAGQLRQELKAFTQKVLPARAAD